MIWEKVWKIFENIFIDLEQLPNNSWDFVNRDGWSMGWSIHRIVTFFLPTFSWLVSSNWKQFDYFDWKAHHTVSHSFVTILQNSIGYWSPCQQTFDTLWSTQLTVALHLKLFSGIHAHCLNKCQLFQTEKPVNYASSSLRLCIHWFFSCWCSVRHRLILYILSNFGSCFEA